MANLTNVLTVTPEEIAGTATEYLRLNAVFLPVIYRERKFENELVGGGSSGSNLTFVTWAPQTMVEPQDYTPGATDCDTTPTSDIDLTPQVVTINRHKFHRIRYTEWQNRLAYGGFKFAFGELFGPFIDGIISVIEKDIAAQYANAGIVVGAGATPLTDATFRSAIKQLADNRVPIDPSHIRFVSGTDAYWNDLLDDADYRRYDGSGDKAALVSAKVIENKYNVPVMYSTSIVNSAGSGSSTTHNLLFAPRAIGIAFMQWMKIADQVGTVGQNVEESSVADNGVVIRVLKYYDPKCKYVVIEMTVDYGVWTRQPLWIADVRS